MKKFRVLLAALAVITAFAFDVSAFKSPNKASVFSTEPLYEITDPENDFYEAAPANEATTEERCPGNDRPCAVELDASGPPNVIRWDGPETKF